jgi:hypothetical protein
MTLKFIALLLALICFVLATFGVQSRVNLLALGLALWVLTQMV